MPLTKVKQKETTQFTRKTIQETDKQRNQRDCYTVSLEGSESNIKIIKFSGMCDGKVIKALEKIT